MKRILIIANTYYQMIVAIQLQNTLFQNDEVVLLLSDHSKGTDAIVEKLKQQKTFAQVEYLQSLNFLRNYKHTFLQKLQMLWQYVFGTHNECSFYLREIQNLQFDEMMVFNWGSDIFALFFLLYEHNKNIKVSRFEEGILSYNSALHESIISSTGKAWKTVKILRHLFGKKHISDVLHNYYCFYPKIYCGDLNPIEIPKISKGSKTAITLKNIFGLDKANLDYKEKYIFFTSVYDFEGGEPIGEFEVAQQIADLVGKQNLLIKEHPRDRRNLYRQNGFKVDENSSIPWEAIQLSGNFEDKIFLTATSGSVLAGSLMSDTPVKTFYTCDLCKISGNDVESFMIFLKKLISDSYMKDIFQNIFIANTCGEILQ